MEPVENSPQPLVGTSGFSIVPRAVTEAFELRGDPFITFTDRGGGGYPKANVVSKVA